MIGVIDMDNITLEKAIVFSTNIESLHNVSVKDSIDYKLLEDGCSVIGVIKLSGSAFTLKGLEPFEEHIDVDIFAPFDQVIDKSKFSLTIEDYSYQILKNAVVFKIKLKISGFLKMTEEVQEPDYETEKFNLTNEIDEIMDDSPLLYDNEILKEFEDPTIDASNLSDLDEDIKNELNNENQEIVEEEDAQKEVAVILKEPILAPISFAAPLMESREEEKNINSNWAHDLFKDNDSYVTFYTIHRSEDDEVK